MPATEAELCNIALGRIGVKQFLNDIVGPSLEARCCKEFYPHARDVVLAAYPWRFATRRATLAELSGAERSGWEFVYALPTDFITARFLYAGVRDPTPDVRIQFELEFDPTTSKRVLLTDLEDAELAYVYRMTPVALYPPLFAEAVAWKLAADLALTIPVKPAVGQEFLRNNYAVAAGEAFAADLRNAQEAPAPEAEAIRMR